MENNKWAVITGASSGIGKEFAYQLGKKGYNVALVARSRDKLEAIAADIQKQFGRETRVIPLDLTHRDFARELADRTVDMAVTMVINNAGFGTSGSFLEIEDDREIEMITLNCSAVTQVARLFLKRMAKNGEGNMIIVASTASVQPCPWFATYAATKAFDRFLAEALWYEMKPKGVNVLALNPPGTATQFFAEAGLSDSPKRLATVEQVVRTAFKALGKRPSVIVGVNNRFMAFTERFTPEKLLIAITSRIMKKMIGTS
ncbi:MAG: SDR family oxidoreductase [Acidobacteria bacterium]|nr:SDR family oxidoreductase [Acidobacteriota bacterium]